MKPYYPSNGTEGMMFIERFCEKCYKYKQCTILTNSMLGKEPKQWIYDEQDKPTCTSFASERPNKAKVKVNDLPKLF